jgi:tRNA threonylcarbamoyladenosine modification (KEOPS) complex  Pcc1 subunit
MNRAYVEIEVEAARAEAKALLDALRPESDYGRAPFRISLTRDGLVLKVTGRSLSDARVFTNSVLRLLKAARESIQAVD